MFDTFSATPSSEKLDGRAAVCIFPLCGQAHLWGSQPLKSSGWFTVPPVLDAGALGLLPLKITHAGFPVEAVLCPHHSSDALTPDEASEIRRVFAVNGASPIWARDITTMDQLLVAWLLSRPWLSVDPQSDGPMLGFLHQLIRRDR